MHVLVRCLAAWSPPRGNCSARCWVVLLGLPLVLLTSSAMAAPVTLAWDASVSMVQVVLAVLRPCQWHLHRPHRRGATSPPTPSPG